MQNARMDDSQTVVKTARRKKKKTARRNINNLKHADVTDLMTESEEELKSLFMTVKEESEKASLKFNIQ